MLDKAANCLAYICRRVFAGRRKVLSSYFWLRFGTKLTYAFYYIKEPGHRIFTCWACPKMFADPTSCGIYSAQEFSQIKFLDYGTRQVRSQPLGAKAEYRAQGSRSGELGGIFVRYRSSIRGGHRQFHNQKALGPSPSPLPSPSAPPLPPSNPPSVTLYVSLFRLFTDSPLGQRLFSV